MTEKIRNKERTTTTEKHFFNIQFRSHSPQLLSQDERREVKEGQEQEKVSQRKEGELSGFLCSNSNPFILSKIEREEERMIRMKISNVREINGFRILSIVSHFTNANNVQCSISKLNNETAIQESLVKLFQNLYLQT